MSASRNAKAEFGRPRRLNLILPFVDRGCVLSALDRLIKVFDTPTANPADMARSILMSALANVEIIVPRIDSMINYCEAEGIGQTDYLESLIETKFKNKLYRVKNRWVA